MFCKTKQETKLSSTQHFCLLTHKNNHQKPSWFGPASGLSEEEENKLKVEARRKEKVSTCFKNNLFPVYKLSRQGKWGDK